MDTHQAVRGPLLLISGSDDHPVPKKVTLEVAKMYEDSPDSITEYREFAGRGHSLTIDAGWRAIADATLDWLSAQHLDTPNAVPGTAV